MAASSDSLADILERVLDKGVVIAGDIGVSVVDVELLTLRIRLFIASAQTAREMGMDWWTNDPFFAPNAERRELAARVADLEARLPVPGGKEEPR
ncbi:gas vesicle protein [Amycolatopsis vancoresmycina]|uniref:Gas vesicle protein GVPa n=1 Tax=Amycolatopsis vancoresmycina DSM 44592 TaxID=1292037 RepID=R1HM83_9PSEU|nr:gas vesicle protein [Amycolatopsis vancoresmycina]EOD64675.1 gas vesicle protein GVPa [Amycolatopsis vancoresmycina DSM 44592]